METILLIITLWIALLTLIMTTVKIDFAQRWRLLISGHLALITGIWINGLFNPEYKIWTYQQFTSENIKNFNLIDNFSIWGILGSIFWSVIFYFLLYGLIKYMTKTLFHNKLINSKTFTDRNQFIKNIGCMMLSLSFRKKFSINDPIFNNDDIIKTKTDREQFDYNISASVFRILIWIHLLICIIIFDFPYKCIFIIIIILLIMILIYLSLFSTTLRKYLDTNSDK